MSSRRNKTTPVKSQTQKPKTVKEETQKQTPAEFYQARRDKAIADGKKE